MGDLAIDAIILVSSYVVSFERIEIWPGLLGLGGDFAHQTFHECIDGHHAQIDIASGSHSHGIRVFFFIPNNEDVRQPVVITVSQAPLPRHCLSSAERRKGMISFYP